MLSIQQFSLWHARTDTERAQYPKDQAALKIWPLAQVPKWKWRLLENIVPITSAEVSENPTHSVHRCLVHWFITDSQKTACSWIIHTMSSNTCACLSCCSVKERTWIRPYLPLLLGCNQKVKPNGEFLQLGLHCKIRSANAKSSRLTQASFNWASLSANGSRQQRNNAKHPGSRVGLGSPGWNGTTAIVTQSS